MTDHMRPTDEDLQAFIDGELDAEHAGIVEAAVQEDAELARRVHAHRADKVRLQQIYGSLIDRPVPQAWLDTIANRNIVPLAGKRSRRDILGWAVAASVAVAVGGSLILQRLSMRGDEDILSAAMAAHAQARVMQTQPVAEDALAKIVGVAVKAPDLSKMGFSLVGMQTRDEAIGTAAVLAYRDAGERIFTLYLKASSGTPAFDMIKQGDTRICLWQDDVLSAVMLADVSAAEMLRLASLAYSGLTA